jgi:hypothetical protein
MYFRLFYNAQEIMLFALNRYWESIEMFRKFLMTSLLVNLIAVGQPEQVAAGKLFCCTTFYNKRKRTLPVSVESDGLETAGILITFCFLIFYTALQPYCTANLSKTQTCSLIAQFITLFSGLCLVVESYIKKELKRAGQVDTTDQSSAIFGTLILGINLIISAWPLILISMSGGFVGRLSTIKSKCINPSKFKSELAHKEHMPVSESGQRYRLSSDTVYYQVVLHKQDSEAITIESDCPETRIESQRQIQQTCADPASGVWEVSHAISDIEMPPLHQQLPSPALVISNSDGCDIALSVQAEIAAVPTASTEHGIQHLESPVGGALLNLKSPVTAVSEISS